MENEAGQTAGTQSTLKNSVLVGSRSPEPDALELLSPGGGGNEPSPRRQNKDLVLTRLGLPEEDSEVAGQLILESGMDWQKTADLADDLRDRVSASAKSNAQVLGLSGFLIEFKDSSGEGILGLCVGVKNTWQLCVVELEPVGEVAGKTLFGVKEDSDTLYFDKPQVERILEEGLQWRPSWVVPRVCHGTVPDALLGAFGEYAGRFCELPVEAQGGLKPQTLFEGLSGS